ncbi:MAG: LysE family translocator [Alphaproteobacteria bacterium]
MLAFLAVAALVIVTPGPDTAVTVRSALLGGRAAGIATAAGVALGQLVWAAATSLGLVALLIASEPLFLLVKYLGAAWLVVLGLQALAAAWRAAPAAATIRGPAGLAPRAAFGHGLLSDLGNPKMAVFFASVLPQFARDGSFLALFGLGAIFAAMTFLWLAGYALAVARAGDVLRRPSVRRWLEAVAGATLLALGLRVAAEPR